MKSHHILGFFGVSVARLAMSHKRPFATRHLPRIDFRSRSATSPFTEIRNLLFRTESTTCSAFSKPVVRFRPLVVYLSIENRIAPMAYPGTKLRSPRGSVMANVKTMGGRRSRYWCGPGSVRANQNGARLSESGSGAPHILLVTSVLLTRSAKRSCRRVCSWKW